MKRLLGSVLLLLSASTVQAHPGVSIVQDSRGNVFFTDLKQVWKITPDGKKSVAVANVHTHELYLDAEDYLYGEHLWSEAGGWRHRVWCLKRDGAIVDVIPTREGYPKDYGLVRDGAGNTYWADRGEHTVIKKRSPDGKTSTHAIADFRMVQWMTVTPTGTLFLMDGADLRRATPDGKVTTIAARLSEHNPPPSNVSERNYHMGLWTDREGLVYVAIGAERLVLKVGADGRTSVVARSPGGWSPSGGMFDRNGRMWLLEYNATNDVRARRI